MKGLHALILCVSSGFDPAAPFLTFQHTIKSLKHQPPTPNFKYKRTSKIEGYTKYERT